MAVPFAQSAFAVGELSPSMTGRYDLARFHVASGTQRNIFTKYQGGAASRAGTAFCGFSKQTGPTPRSYPPRMIPFQFNLRQGLALEFGHEYMRVLQNGAYVTSVDVVITGASQASPTVITYTSVNGVTGATADNTDIYVSYNGGDEITMDGGTYEARAVLGVIDTELLFIEVEVPQTGAGNYAPGDTIVLAGGTQTLAPELDVLTTTVTTATVAAGGAGGTPGVQSVAGTTGTGVPFTASVIIDAGGVMTDVVSITTGGSYTVNPAVPAAEPVVGAGLAGAQLDVKLGVLDTLITVNGTLTTNPTDLRMTQASTSGAGTGAVFRSAIFGIASLSIINPGVYSVMPTNPVSQASTTGNGRGTVYTLVSGTVPAFVNGDWVSITDIVGMTELNGRVFVIKNVTNTTFELTDVYGVNINSAAYTAYGSGGSAALIYTLETPYSEVDLQYLKFTQSADVMSLCCVNTTTLTEYYPQELSRLANNDFVIAPLDVSATINPPAAFEGLASASGTTNYKYVVTAVSQEDGTESVASVVAEVNAAVNIAATAGSIRLFWQTVRGAAAYNIYKATPGYNGTVLPVGIQYGFAGQALANEFIDSNIVPDFSQVPPVHRNPFARGRILSAPGTASGTGYTTASAVITTSTGTGAILEAVLINGGFASFYIVNEGENYAPTDTVAVVGDGAGATAVLVIGAQSGTYPAVVSYFQQRRAYANTLNQPDTYFMSQPGGYLNFDTRTPPLDSDAIIGNPWAEQVEGIQFMLNMPGGLLALTGLGNWQLTGSGGSSLNPQAITPTNQQAQPQGYNGCHNHVGPTKIENEYLYVQAKGSIVRDASYNFSTNIYSGADITLNSSHLFTGHQIVDRAWCEEPFKIWWAVRDDGILLSLTFVKAQEVVGWARHDTAGLFKSLCSVVELPVDALYVAVQRIIGSRLAYTVERLDNRLWTSVEDSWCVDCGVALPQTEPAATLRAGSATGFGSISGFTDLIGGAGYSSGTFATVVDDGGHGPGSGSTATLTIVGGVITNIVLSPGSQYTYPALVITDPANSDGGSGASARLTLNNAASFYASASVFSGGDVGSVIRMGGGIAVITSVVSGTEVAADIISPIVDVIANSGGIPQPQVAGQWTMTAPVSTVTGLQYLEGATVTGLYDGKVLPPTIVPSSGSITLPESASQVVIGFGFTAQLQTIQADPPGTTIQGQRKVIPGVTMRLEASRDVQVGTNQIDGSAQSPPQIEAEWTDLTDLPNRVRPPYNSDVEPLWTGDVHTSVFGGFDTPGQVAIQQSSPLPLNVLAAIPDILPGDMPELQAKQRRGGKVDEE